MDRATVEVDPKKRAALYHDFQKRVVEASPIVFVHELDFVTVYNKRLQGFLVSPLGIYANFDQAWVQK
jgi:peptide/nickel transport system substrate-binding protein